MAEKVLKIKTLSEVAEAISGLTDLSGSLKGVGTAAVEASGKAKAEWKALEAEWTKSTATAKGVADQVFKVESALNAMGRASSASQLEGSLVKSQIAFRQLQSTIRDVAATGSTIDDGVVSSMNVMKASIDAGKAKLNELRSTTEAAKKELGLLGEAGQKAGTAVSGVSKSTDTLGDSMRKSTERLNKFRGATLEIWAAIGIGKDIGNALADQINKVDAALADHDKRMNDAAVNTIKFQAAMKLARQGLIDIGGSQDQFLARYDAYIAKTSPAVKATEAQTKAFKDQKTALDELGQQMEASGKSVEFKINAPKIEDLLPLEEATKYAERLNDILGKAFKEGGEAERNEWAAANQETIEKVIASFERWGEEVPPHVRAAYDAMTAASVDWVAQLDQEAAAYDRRVRAQQVARAETDRAADGMRKWTDATQGTGKAFGALSGDFTSLNKAVADYVAAGGDVAKIQVGMATIALEVAKANDAATASIYRHLEATKLLREEQALALDAAQGWRDYLANLKEGYDTGLTSLSGYMKGLIDFKAQLLQLFGSVSGEAKRGLEDVIAMIEALMQTVGSREAFDTSYAGQAQRAFDKGGK